MPVVPNFSGYAPTPNLATAYLGGARLRQEGMIAQDKLAQDASEAGQRFQLGREKIAQEQSSDEARLAQAAAIHSQQLQFEQQKLAQAAEMDAMHNAIKQDQLQKSFLVSQQKMEIDKSYKEQQIGIRQSQLEQQGELTRARTQEAMRHLHNQRLYQQAYMNAKDAGKTDEEAARNAMLVIGPGEFGGAGTEAVRGQRPPPSANLPTEFQRDPSKSYITRGGAYIPPVKPAATELEAKPVPGAGPTVVNIGGKPVHIPDPATAKRAELKALRAEATKMSGKESASVAEVAKGNATERNKAIAAQKAARDKRIKQLEDEIDELAKSRNTSTATIPSSVAAPTSGTATNRFVWDPDQQRLVPKGR